MVTNGFTKICLFIALLLPLTVLAAVPYELRIDDPTGALQGTNVRQSLDEALNAWSEFIDLKPSLVIQLRVGATGEGRIEGASTSNHILTQANGLQLLEESAVYKLRTGLHLHRDEADIVIGVNAQYLRNELLVAGKIDLVSVFAHELCHAFGMNGFLNHVNGESTVPVRGGFDRFVVKQDGRFYFTGPHAMRVFGGPVPLTSTNLSQNIYHYANADDSPRSLKTGLMNGLHLEYGHRYKISPLDVAILHDVGVPLRKASVPGSMISKI